jgi:hypothetical protein
MDVFSVVQGCQKIDQNLRTQTFKSLHPMSAGIFKRVETITHPAISGAGAHPVDLTGPRRPSPHKLAASLAQGVVDIGICPTSSHFIISRSLSTSRTATQAIR